MIRVDIKCIKCGIWVEKGTRPGPAKFCADCAAENKRETRKSNAELYKKPHKSRPGKKKKANAGRPPKPKPKFMTTKEAAAYVNVIDRRIVTFIKKTWPDYNIA